MHSAVPGRQYSANQPALTTAGGARSIIAWIAAALIAACIISPVLTAYGAIDAVNTGSRGELETTPLRTFGYIIREGSYLILGIFGFVILLTRKNGTLFALSSTLLIAFILIKDIVIYGNLDWAPYGLRPLLIAVSVATVSTLLRWNCQRQLRIVEFTIKVLIAILIPITANQLVTLPSVFGATFLGPRTLGFWPNPINYSMALASFALYLTVCKSRHSAAWLVACALLAITTGGRSGLLAIALLIGVQVFRRLGFTKPSREMRPLVALLGPVVAIVAVTGLFAIFSQQQFSGREGTENARYGDSRAAYVVDSVGSIAAEGGVVALLLGNRLGDGTNALFSSGKSSVISDNFFLMVIRSYGFLGLLIFTLMTFAWLRRPSVDKMAIALAAFSFMMAQSFLEQHPVAILTLAAAALSASPPLRPWGPHSPPRLIRGPALKFRRRSAG